MIRQLTLPIQTHDQATFENFLVGKNTALLHSLQALPASGQGSVYFWGKAGVGRSHLLQAVCHQRSLAGLSAAYVPLSQSDSLSPSMLEGLEDMDIVCIDDLQSIMGHPSWEFALFSLYNRAQEAGTPLFLSANIPCKALSYQLIDLQSRLSGTAAFQVHDLSDTEKLQLLVMRAQERGMLLSESVGQFLLSRYPRSTTELLAQLDILESASLEEQHRLTIPFVKSVLLRH